MRKNCWACAAPVNASETTRARAHCLDFMESSWRRLALTTTVNHATPRAAIVKAPSRELLVQRSAPAVAPALLGVVQFAPPALGGTAMRDRQGRFRREPPL